MVNFGAWDSVPERFKVAQAVPPQPERHADAHHGRREPRHRRIHRRQAERDARPGALPDPRRRRVGASTSPASPSTTPRPTACCSTRIAQHFRPGPDRTLHTRCRCTSTTRPSPTPLVAAWHEIARSASRARTRLRRTTTMPRIARRRSCSTASAPRSPPAEPIIGGGAGTGLSAKCEEAGGIDLIVIYNSGRYRMAGRGSLAGLLAYGNANEIVCEMAREVLPVVKHTPVLAGVNGTDPFMIPDEFLRRLDRPGLLGRAELPDRRPDRRHLPRQPGRNRHGLRAGGRADRPARASSTC